MTVMIDLRDLIWKDTKTNNYRIVEFKQENGKDLVWYINLESLEEYCMDAESFLNEHTSAGLFEEV